MKKVFYLKIGQLGSGLTNQMFTLITCIIISINNNINAIIIDNFHNDYSNNETTPITKILNIPKINAFLKKYNITLFDKNDTTFKLENVKYGINDKFINITKEVLDKFSNIEKNALNIPIGTNFNLIVGDPCFGVKKVIDFYYKLNDVDIHEIFNENFDNKISFDILNANYKNTFGWINSYDKNIFEEILKNITFNDYFLELVTNNTMIIQKENLNINNLKWNVIHLRLENDAVNHWSKMNNMDKEFFKKYIEDKYIEIVKKYVDKTDNTLILSDSIDNNVINYLKNNNYVYFFPDKNFINGRELNAIVDLLFSEKCNNIFVGNFNISKLNGSTFSYCISQKMNNNVKQILIDLDKITDDENIHYNNNAPLLINYSYLIDK